MTCDGTSCPYTVSSGQTSVRLGEGLPGREESESEGPESGTFLAERPHGQKERMKGGIYMKRG